MLEAHGGILCKLDRFMLMNELEVSNDGDDIDLSYTYRKTDHNLDFTPGRASLTKYNAADGVDITTATGTEQKQNRTATNVPEVKPYANLCGLVAISKPENNRLSRTKDLV